MSIRPIDLQILLKQMGEVSKKETQRIRKKDDDADAAVQKNRDKRVPGGESDTLISETEASTGVHNGPDRLDRRPKRKSRSEKKPADNVKKDEGLKGDFQGNFLDITE